MAHIAAQTPPSRPQELPRCLQDGPKSAQELPRRLQDAPESLQELPREPENLQDSFQMAPRAAKARTTEPLELLRGVQEVSTTPSSHIPEYKNLSIRPSCTQPRTKGVRRYSRSVLQSAAHLPVCFGVLDCNPRLLCPDHGSQIPLGMLPLPSLGPPRGAALPSWEVTSMQVNAVSMQVPCRFMQHFRPR